ncbi:katanin p80 WD40 repeat-containing subunit B1 isoform X4 [Dendroctonus ponderosae]|uniref:Katanin p80 WD40 repeat-containing subunit B1 n=1 Tax=Dendroctonus ponderosae TaxID=77166 RepID=A0AAR5P6D8_DENPD|nr:katanin p80 WD40 repeat-containing subunit B1 isoform X4 [Dendroctonus ponderosae]
MASLNTRSWRLQDFAAHNANVNCLALGHKSGRVMVTGGDDKKVNLWAVGKQSCFMSLSGHLTPVDCVQFNKVEELVCAGSRAGALKVWDLEAAKLVRTLNGHKQNIKCIDFNPYGDLLASGSGDSTIKIWDTRKKGVIYSYNGHQGTVNSIKFSPDAQWVASGGEDSTVKIWDLRVGRVLKQFDEHLNAVTCVEFHPHEFLLATGGLDRSVHFFDLENFSLVSSERDLGALRSLCFNPDGDSLFAAVRDYIQIIGWEPSRLHDSVPVLWGNVCDISTAQNQLVGASFYLTNVQVYVVDLKKCFPMGSLTTPTINQPATPFTQHPSLRKSFSKADRPVSLKGRTLDVKTIEESTSGTDPEEESIADITNMNDYHEIFRARTPPPEPEPFQIPERDFTSAPVVYDNYPTEPQILGDNMTENVEALSLDNSVNNYLNSDSEPPNISPNKFSRSKSNLDQVYLRRLTKQQDRENILPSNKPKPAPKFSLQRQTSVKEGTERIRTKSQSDGMKHSASEASITRGTNSSRVTSRKNSFSKPSRNSSVPNVSAVKNIRNSEVPKSIHITNRPVDLYVKKLSPDDIPVEENEFVPSCIDRPVGVDFDDFLPKNFDILGSRNYLPEMSEAEGLGLLMRGHERMQSIFSTRNRNTRLILAHFRNRDIKHSVESAVSMDDISILIDILGVINNKYTIWNLDLCVTILPKLIDLLQSKYEQYMTVGCTTLKLILRHFGPVIRSNIQSPVGSFGVDIPREERYQKSVKCHEMLSQLRSCIVKKLSLPGNMGATFREVQSMMVTTLD